MVHVWIELNGKQTFVDDTETQSASAVRMAVLRVNLKPKWSRVASGVAHLMPTHAVVTTITKAQLGNDHL
jgi:hypothetical protein